MFFQGAKRAPKKSPKFCFSKLFFSFYIEYIRMENLDLEICEKKHSAVCAVWDFRANEDVFTADVLRQWMISNCKKYVFQKEKGDTGYIHWQGRFSLIKKRNKSSILKLFTIGKPNYLEPTVKENHQESFFYALKEDTRIEGPYCDPSHEKVGMYMPKQYRDIVLYAWQLIVIASRLIFDSRGIDVIYDPDGNNGKSTVAAIAELLYGAIDMPTLYDFEKLVFLACNICMGTNNHSPGLMFFDMPRACTKSQLNGFYSAIEQIKKGKLFDTRNHYKQFWIDSPRIWVFTNEMPDISLLSRDRWRFWVITKDKNLVPMNLGSDVITVQHVLNGCKVGTIPTAIPVPKSDLRVAKTLRGKTHKRRSTPPSPLFTSSDDE